MDDEEVEKPKKCLSAYMIFVRETRQKITHEHPDMQALNVMKEVGRRWQAIDIVSKREFERKSDEDKRGYNDQYREYQRKISILQQRMKDQISLGKGKDFGIIASKLIDRKMKPYPPMQKNPNQRETDQKAAESLQMVKKHSESPTFPNVANPVEPLSSRSNDKPI